MAVCAGRGGEGHTSTQLLSACRAPLYVLINVARHVSAALSTRPPQHAQSLPFILFLSATHTLASRNRSATAAITPHPAACCHVSPVPATCCALIDTIFPPIYARMYHVHPRARVISFSRMSLSMACGSASLRLCLRWRRGHRYASLHSHTCTRLHIFTRRAHGAAASLARLHRPLCSLALDRGPVLLFKLFGGFKRRLDVPCTLVPRVHFNENGLCAHRLAQLL